MQYADPNLRSSNPNENYYIYSLKNSFQEGEEDNLHRELLHLRQWRHLRQQDLQEVVPYFQHNPWQPPQKVRPVQVSAMDLRHQVEEHQRLQLKPQVMVQAEALVLLEEEVEEEMNPIQITVIDFSLVYSILSVLYGSSGLSGLTFVIL